MMIRSLILMFVLAGENAKGDTGFINAVANTQGKGGCNDKADTLLKAKFNFTTNGSFCGEFGKFASPEAEGVVAAPQVESKPSEQGERLQASNRDLVKELMTNLLKRTRRGNKGGKRHVHDQLVAFVPKLDGKQIPIKPPSVFDHTDTCVYKSHHCWCKEQPITCPCTWETDCMCISTVTCGPTKPCIEHRDKWCYLLAPDIYEQKTVPPCQGWETIPFCTTKTYNPCATFRPPCFNPTPYTIEPCICPTPQICTCPCPPGGTEKNGTGVLLNGGKDALAIGNCSPLHKDEQFIKTGDVSKDRITHGTVKYGDKCIKKRFLPIKGLKLDINLSMSGQVELDVSSPHSNIKKDELIPFTGPQTADFRPSTRDEVNHLPRGKPCAHENASSDKVKCHIEKNPREWLGLQFKEVLI